MEPQEAEKLVQEIQRRPLVFRMPETTRKEITDYLVCINPSEAVTTLEEKEFRLLEYPDREWYENDMKQYLSLRRILDNRKVMPCKKSIWQMFTGNTIRDIGFFSSDAIVRDLLSNKEIFNLIASCKDRYSLVGKIETVDLSSSGNDKKYVAPLIIIPGFSEEALEFQHRYAKGFGFEY